MHTRPLGLLALLLLLAHCGGEATLPQTESAALPVFNGTDVQPGTYPWLTKTRNCTGALISPNYVLTAAHCYGYAQRNAEGTLVGIEFRGGPVRVGHPDHADPAARVVDVREVRLHPEYILLTRDEVWGLEPYDIALLELAEPVYLSDYLRLPSRQPDEAELLIAAGWGQTEDGFVSLARETVLQVRSRRQCFGGDNKRFCTTGGPENPSSNIGGGDSGGPVFVAVDDGYMGLGINSTSSRDANPNDTFASHAATFAYMDWVLEATEGHFHCPNGDPSNGCIPLVDECSAGLAQCDGNASCVDAIEGFSCQCRSGFAGDGFRCEDVDECTNGTASCGANSVCRNTVGSFTCECGPDFTGDGITCSPVPVSTAEGCRAADSSPGSFAILLALGAYLAPARRRRRFRSRTSP